MDKYDNIINQVESLFEANRAKEAEGLLLNELNNAKNEKAYDFQLQILNELIGYYRQTSEKEALIAVMEQALAVADKMGLNESEEGKIPYATTVLNVANGYRSIGDLQQSEELFGVVLKIYNEILGEKDMLLAGLYNNYSLLYQEHGDYERAMEYQKKALHIVEENAAGFEIAVTYANLANTAILMASKNINTTEALDLAEEYACEAIKRFEERNTIDVHYCAALSALGMCLYKKGNVKRAQDFFKKGMDIIEKSFGKNGQYYRMKENYDMCGEKPISGLELSKQYYETYGKEMLSEKFPALVSRMVIGLVGEGSDCFGFDDTYSTDHDWGPGFCILVPEDIYKEYGEEIQEAYENLPKEFMGYETKTTRQGINRRGVINIAEFCKSFIGTTEYEKIDYRKVTDYELLAVTNGEVFRDDLGEFTALREKIKKGFPKEILYLRLAQDMAEISQTGQYNYNRMLKRGDRITADIMLSSCMMHIMTLAHHMENKYIPHDKWLHRSFENLDNNATIGNLLDRLHESFRMDAATAGTYVEEIMEQVGAYFANELYARNYISDVEAYLDYHTDELVKKSEYERLSTEELVNAIARIEYEAFDKVRNEGGRAYCQNDWPTFSIMRKSQYLTWNRDMLLQYLYDFEREYKLGHNLITEKYGRMMESTAPEKYREIEEHFPKLSKQKKAVIEQIVAVQVSMLESFGEQYPFLSQNTRSFHTYEDDYVNTSYETYLRGEISTYSDKMLQLYGKYVVECTKEDRNIASEIIRNTAKLYGFEDLDAFEASARKN